MTGHSSLLYSRSQISKEICKYQDQLSIAQSMNLQAVTAKSLSIRLPSRLMAS